MNIITAAVLLMLASLVSAIEGTSSNIILDCLSDCERKFKGAALRECNLHCSVEGYSDAADESNSVFTDYRAVTKGLVGLENKQLNLEKVTVGTYSTKSDKSQSSKAAKEDSSKAGKGPDPTPQPSPSPTGKPVLPFKKIEPRSVPIEPATVAPEGNAPIEPRSAPIKPAPTPEV
ncbi:hypothetical protein ACHAXN_012729, partial [Cyclotella atomus]